MGILEFVRDWETEGFFCMSLWSVCFATDKKCMLILVTWSGFWPGIIEWRNRKVERLGIGRWGDWKMGRLDLTTGEIVGMGGGKVCVRWGDWETERLEVFPICFVFVAAMIKVQLTYKQITLNLYIMSIGP